MEGRPWPPCSKSSSSSIESPRMPRSTSAHRRWLRCWRVPHLLLPAFPPTRLAAAPGQFMTRVGSSRWAMRYWNPGFTTLTVLYAAPRQCQSQTQSHAEHSPEQHRAWSGGLLTDHSWQLTSPPIVSQAPPTSEKPHPLAATPRLGGACTQSRAQRPIYPDCTVMHAIAVPDLR